VSILFIYVGVRFKGFAVKSFNFRISLPPAESKAIENIEFEIHFHFSFADLQYNKSTNVPLKRILAKGFFIGFLLGPLAFAPFLPLFPWARQR
jgi:hypothetical protein